nr:ABC transporter permease [Rhodoferax sp.]
MQGSNPHASPSVSLNAIGISLWSNRQLIARMARREVVGRYRGSVLGLAWSFFHPILMLVVYTFVFSEIFGLRWGGTKTASEEVQYASNLFVGMIVFGVFSEVFNRAPGLISSNINYVKKVIFPLEILPFVSLVAALFHAFVSIAVLLVVLGLVYSQLHWTVIFIPVVLFPLVVLTLGIAWLFASLGVFSRDVGQMVGIATSVLMFLSPVFYPVSSIPVKFRSFLMANPLTFIIEQAREVLILGHLPDWSGLAIYLLCALAVAWIGYAWFQSTRKGFADVL